jgi:hypothetical protein
MLGRVKTYVNDVDVDGDDDDGDGDYDDYFDNADVVDDNDYDDIMMAVFGSGQAGQ